MSPSEKGIIRLVRERDTEAFGELVASYQSSVYGIALSTIGDAEEAEDVAQTCFVEAFSRIGELRDGDRFSPWLFAIARNKCRDWLRHNSRRPALVGDPSELPSADPPELPDGPGPEPPALSQRILPLIPGDSINNGDPLTPEGCRAMLACSSSTDTRASCTWNRR